MFECGKCGWQLDRQLNAALNILQTALASAAQAGDSWASGIRFSRDALRKDAMNPLYEPTRVARGERSAGSPKSQTAVA